MRSERIRLLVVTAAAVAVLAPSAVREARAFPFFGKKVCQPERQKLGHEERILGDRQRLAFDQCRAGAGGSKNRRCEDMKEQHKVERKRFSDQRERTLEDCKRRAEAPKSAEAPKTAAAQKSSATPKKAAAPKNVKQK